MSSPFNSVEFYINICKKILIFLLQKRGESVNFTIILKGSSLVEVTEIVLLVGVGVL